MSFESITMSRVIFILVLCITEHVSFALTNLKNSHFNIFDVRPVEIDEDLLLDVDPKQTIQDLVTNLKTS